MTGGLHKLRDLLIASAIVLVASTTIHAQASLTNAPLQTPLREEILKRVPTVYREQARKSVTATGEEQDWLATRSDAALEVAIIQYLAAQPGSEGFLLERLKEEPSAKIRSSIIESMSEYWKTEPRSAEVLKLHASSDTDADVALVALKQLRDVRMDELGGLLESRLVAAKQAGDSGAVEKLAKEQEYLYGRKHELPLPGFLRVPPPLFSIKPQADSIRVLAFGDFGTGSAEQKRLAGEMINYNQVHPFDFGLTLGDNFYDYGIDSLSDPRWQSEWESLYGPLGIKFYPTFGNHDYGQEDSPAAELLYSNKSPDWRFPSPYYTFTAGPVQFFAIDTIKLSEAELLWLDDALGKSRAPWKLVYGHYPIYSATRGDNKLLISKLLPILKKQQVDVYLTGHDHNLQELTSEGSVHFFVSGGGGAELYDLKTYEHSVFKEKVNGFTVIEADSKHFKVSFVDTEGKQLYVNTLEK
jgi:hypothetical protein